MKINYFVFLSLFFFITKSMIEEFPNKFDLIDFFKKNKCDDAAKYIEDLKKLIKDPKRNRNPYNILLCTNSLKVSIPEFPIILHIISSLNSEIYEIIKNDIQNILRNMPETEYDKYNYQYEIESLDKNPSKRTNKNYVIHEKKIEEYKKSETVIENENKIDLDLYIISLKNSNVLHLSNETLDDINKAIDTGNLTCLGCNLQTMITNVTNHPLRIITNTVINNHENCVEQPSKHFEKEFLEQVNKKNFLFFYKPPDSYYYSDLEYIEDENTYSSTSAPTIESFTNFTSPSPDLFNSYSKESLCEYFFTFYETINIHERMGALWNIFIIIDKKYDFFYDMKNQDDDIIDDYIIVESKDFTTEIKEDKSPYILLYFEDFQHTAKKLTEQNSKILEQYPKINEKISLFKEELLELSIKNKHTAPKIDEIELLKIDNWITEDDFNKEFIEKTEEQISTLKHETQELYKSLYEKYAEIAELEEIFSWKIPYKKTLFLPSTNSPEQKIVINKYLEEIKKTDQAKACLLLITCFGQTIFQETYIPVLSQIEDREILSLLLKIKKEKHINAINSFLEYQKNNLLKKILDQLSLFSSHYINYMIKEHFQKIKKPALINLCYDEKIELSKESLDLIYPLLDKNILQKELKKINSSVAKYITNETNRLRECICINENNENNASIYNNNKINMAFFLLLIFWTIDLIFFITK